MIIFENDHIIIINKDNGVPSQMGSGLSLNNVDQVAIDKLVEAYCQEGKLVHRLDRKTSGLMVLAKTKDMAGYIGKSFKGRDIYKAYYALVCGVPKIKSGIIRQSSEHRDTYWEIEARDDKRTLIRSPDFDEHP